jgi:RNase adapter protein RapZ
MAIKLVSFGFKYGKPPEGAKVFDCRPLANPHNVAALRHLTGLHEDVAAFVHRDPKAQQLVRKAVVTAADGDTLAFGCVGGRHRSVALAEKVAATLTAYDYKVEVEHTASSHWK